MNQLSIDDRQISNPMNSEISFISEAETPQKLIIRELTWDDFQGTPDDDDPALAHTKWNIGYNYHVDKNDNQKYVAALDVWCRVDPESWAKTRFIELLKHQQGHFYIGMICALEFKKRVQECEFTDNYKIEISEIFNNTVNEHMDMERAYDIETLNMLNTARQKQWDMKIIKLLNQLQKYA